MSDSSTPSEDNDVLGGDGPGNTTEKDPEQWVTGDQSMTGAQRSYVDTLAREAGETLDANLTKAEASQQIERLQEKTGRGQG
jgi:K+-transporting ATPase c subunit